MRSIPDRVYKAALRLIKIFCVLLTGLLLTSGFLFTCYAENMDSQLVLTKWDLLPVSLLEIALALLLLFVILRYLSHNPVRRKKILLALVLGWYVLAGLILVLFSKTAPTSDSLSVYYTAEELVLGNTNVLHPTESYLSYYPQQIGLVAYYEAVIRLWRMLPVDYPAYHILKCLNIGWACIIILFQSKTVGLLFQNEDAECTYLLFSLFNLPLLLYTSFVYGEVPSFALFSVGLWALTSLLKEWRISLSAGKPFQLSVPRLFLTAGLSLLSFAGAVALRKNTLILMIAVIAIVLFECFFSKPAATGTSLSSSDAPPSTRSGRALFLALALLYLCVSLTVLPLIQTLYEHRTGNRLSSGVPAMSYFAMGMQESFRANGWYNGFNFYTFQETGLDTDATVSISKEAIRQRLAYFGAHPGYTANFYAGKFLSQWADGTYAARQATNNTFGGRHRFFDRLYDGDLSPYFVSFCNIWQNLLYLGAFVFCCTALRPKHPSATDSGAQNTFCPSAQDNLFPWICLISVIGGFLFHTIWEGNSRYIFPYGMLLLPYASNGLSLLAHNMENIYLKIKKS